MKNKYIHITLILWILAILVHSQESKVETDLSVEGQLSAWGNYNPNNDYYIITGARYIPQINYEIELDKKHLFDFEVSANTAGTLAFNNSSILDDGSLDWYRAWARYSNEQFELRFGLQKIDFGTAVMLRSLRWFDQVDPRDPLQLTNGVWGGLARYYFLDNTNIWLWGLYGNKNQKGMEVYNTFQYKPEAGGRIQTVVPRGELGISYHHRKVNSNQFNFMDPDNPISENRLGLDAKFDLIVGLWFEGSWINKDIYRINNQHIYTVGTDYTFGSGLNVTLEHMVYSLDYKAFAFENPVQFTALMATYPIGMFDNISVISYYDWAKNSSYNFVNWRRQFDRTTLYVMAYWNPKNVQLNFTGTAQNMFGGKGLQIMYVFNH